MPYNNVDKYISNVAWHCIPLYSMSKIKYGKLIKKYGVIDMNDMSFGMPGDKTGAGVLKITRVSSYDYVTSSGVIQSKCEVDIEYVGTMWNWGYVMGPNGEIKDGSVHRTWYKKWWSKIERNKAMRRCVQQPLMDRLKYLGIFLCYQHHLTIKKIVWNSDGTDVS